MKKLIGIIAAVAMAASVFALDVSDKKVAIEVTGNVKTNIDILTINLSDMDAVGVDVFKYANGGDIDTHWGIAVGGDKVGGSINIKKGGGASVGGSLWVQPIDQLKFTFGADPFRMNRWNDKYGVLESGTDFTIDIMAIDGLTISGGLTAKSDTVYYMNVAPKFAVKNTAAKISYAADGLGTIDALYVYGGTAANDHSFAIGYKNTFDPITLFVDGMLNVTTELSLAKADLGLSFSQDGFYAGVYSLATFSNLSSSVKTGVLVDAKVSYALDNLTPYATFVDEDVLGDNFDAKVKGGATWTYGSAAIDFGVEYDFGKKTINVPLEIKVSF